MLVCLLSSLFRMHKIEGNHQIFMVLWTLCNCLWNSVKYCECFVQRKDAPLFTCQEEAGGDASFGLVSRVSHIHVFKFE